MTAVLENHTAAALAAVRAGARVCRAVARGDIEAVTKADDSPVTVADFAAQAVIVRRLLASIPDAVVVGEESADLLRDDAALCEAVVAAARVQWPDADRDGVLAAIDAGARRPSGGPYWTLDPIDGTKGFLRRGQYAVCLARVEGSVPAIGVLACPNLDREASAGVEVTAGDGTVLVSSRDGALYTGGIDDVALVEVTVDLDRPREIVITHSVEGEHSRIDRAAEAATRLGMRVHAIPCDSQAKYALVARGQAHAYARIPTNVTRAESVWDHAAGTAVATATGMRVTDLRGDALDFSSPAGLRNNFGILCAHPAIHGELLASIAALGFDHA